MIAFQCECGALVKVSDRFAGRLGKCPQCAKTVRIPGGRPAAESLLEAEPLEHSTGGQGYSLAPPPLSGRGAADSALQQLAADTAAATASHAPHRPVRRPAHRDETHILEITLALATIATIFLPWAIMDRHVGMSWDVIQSAPGIFVAYLIGCWVIALAAVVLGFVLRGLAFGISCASLGFAGAVLMFVTVVTAVSELPYAGPRGDAATLVLSILNCIFLFAMAVATHIRLRTTPTLAVRILQGLTGGLMAVLSLVQLFLLLANRSVLYGDYFALDLTFILMSQLAVVAACVLALVHAAAVQITSKVLSQVSLSLLYGGCGLLAMFIVIRSAATLPAVILAPLHLVIIFTAIIVFLGSGIVRIVTLAAARPGQRTEPSAPEQAGATGPQATTDLERRLKELEDLRVRGVITAEEYANSRRSLFGGPGESAKRLGESIPVE